MAQKKNKNKKNTEDPNARVICRNRRARHNYDILDTVNCGIELLGSEVKSIRNNKVTLEEAYARVDNNEVWLLNCDIAEYPQATMYNHERRRRRKLLLHRREIRKFAESGEQNGLTLIPLSMFISRGYIKVKLGLCRGRRVHDKRENLKKQAHEREMRAAMKPR